MARQLTTAFRALAVALLATMMTAAMIVAAPPVSAHSLLYTGATGSEVAQWQRQLNEVRSENIAVDGIYGPITASATRDFQRSVGITVDGIVGPEARGAMREATGSGSGGGGGGSDGLLRHGDRGSQVRDIQARLESLNYWVGPVDGVYGTLTRQAVLAFQKVNGLQIDGIVGPEVRGALDNPRSPRIRSDRDGLVMEVNKSKQVLISVWNGRLQNIWNTSTGTEQPYTYNGRRYMADTPNGEWKIYRQIDGWRESHLGRLYRPKYFHEDGLAIHGYPRVPGHPASHGCVRVSMAAMDYLWDQMSVGTPVLIYGSIN